MAKLHSIGGLLALTFTCLFPALAAAAVPSDTIMSSSTRGFASIADMNKLEANWNKTQMGHLVKDEAMQPFVSQGARAADAQRVVDRLAAEAEPGETLIAGPVDLSRTNYNDSFFYYLFPELQPGTRYIEMDPGIANTEGSGLADELRSNDWLIVSRSSDLWNEPNDSVIPGSQEPNEVVADQYCLVEDAGSFQLLRRCRDAPDGS